MNDEGDPFGLRDDVSQDGVFHAVRDGYEAVYDALPHGETFNRVWRDNAYRGEFPIEFAHIGFLTETEARRVLELLNLTAGDVLVDLACGAGGPGLWAAQQTGTSLLGIDPAAPGLDAASQRAKRVGLDDRAQFREGTFEHTGLPDASADAIMTIEAFQYAPDKRAALTEFARILKPGGRAAIVCFEVDPAKVTGVPVLGVDPTPDYTPLLIDAGFTIDAYEETPGWAERVYGTFNAVIDAAPQLNTRWANAPQRVRSPKPRLPSPQSHTHDASSPSPPARHKCRYSARGTRHYRAVAMLGSAASRLSPFMRRA